MRPILLLVTLSITGCVHQAGLDANGADTTCAVDAQRLVTKPPRDLDAAQTARLKTLLFGQPLSGRDAQAPNWMMPSESHRAAIEAAADCQLNGGPADPADTVLAALGLGVAPEVPARTQEGLIIAVTDDTSMDATRRYRLGLSMIVVSGWTGENGGDTIWAARQTLALAKTLSMPSNQVRADIEDALGAAVDMGRLLPGSESRIGERLFSYGGVTIPQPGCGPEQRTALEESIKRAADFSFYADLLPANNADRSRFEDDRNRLADVAAFTTLSCTTL